VARKRPRGRPRKEDLAREAELVAATEARVAATVIGRESVQLAA